MPLFRTLSRQRWLTDRRMHRSDVLGCNPWGDPAERELPVYLPPGYRDDGPPHLALWDFAAFTNAGPGHVRVSRSAG